MRNPNDRWATPNLACASTAATAAAAIPATAAAAIPAAPQLRAWAVPVALLGLLWLLVDGKEGR